MLDINKLSNAELKIKLTEMEHEYEVLKNKTMNNVTRMEELDKQYNEVKEALLKRTRGKI
jgi:hypothetical protein